MLTLNRDSIEEASNWADLGLHMEEFPFQYHGMTEEELGTVLEEMEIAV